MINTKVAEIHGYVKHEEFYRWYDPKTNELVCWASLPDYSNDFNATYDVEKHLGLHDRSNLELRVKWVGILRDLVAPSCPVNKVGSPVVSDIDIITADSKIRAMALIKLTEKKKKK